MANNRILLKCVCGEDFVLAKRFLEAYYTVEKDKADKLNEWLEAHRLCEGGPFWDHFDLEYEEPRS